jgi:serine phosphatase RsbU (regulator of sigma subunit)
MIDPRHIRLNYIKPPVVIKRFTADNSEVSLYKKIRLKAGTSKFEIDFAALSFLAPHKVKYRYKLEGDNYTEEWVEDKRSAYYTNLPPGIYRFKVQASNNDGLWNNTGAELRFYIEPRFYQTWWFFILCFLLLLGLGFGVYYFRIYALEQRQKELKQGIEESTRKILDQYNEITRQAEELNTIDKIVKVINQEVRFERVLQALLEQGLLLFPQANKGIFLVYHTEDENYTVAAEKGYEDTKILHQEVSPILLKDYAKYGLRIAEDIQILHPAISPKCLLDNYLPKASLVMKIRLQDHTQGIIFFDNSTGFSEVSSSDIQKLFRFKEHAVTAFSKALTLRELESKNHEVESTLRKMSDSIRYASRIQTAILSKEREIQNFFRDSFIFYRPKDIISGDFYWFTETTPEPEYVMQDGVSVLHGFKDPKAILAAVDCTGHGVPGAFMTVIGNDLLTSIISEEKITKAKTILETLDRKVKTYLRQEENTQSRDGMDMALLVIDSFNQTLEYAGAKNPIVYIRKGEMTEIKPSKYPIGGSQIQRKIFESHTIEYQDGDIFYLFSDGFQDQFGGEVIEGSHERKYTSKRLKELLLKIHQLPFKEQSEALEAEFLAWQGDNRQTDDVLVMGVKF